MSPNLQASFWVRMGLRETDREVCVRAIKEQYAGHVVEEFKDQGYCSFTLLVTPIFEELFQKSPECDTGEKPSEALVVQIRPRQHSLNLRLTRAACEIYGELAPSIRRLDCKLPSGLEAFEMSLLHGVPYSLLRPRSVALAPETSDTQIRLISSFATLIARAWPSTTKQVVESRHLRADSPICDQPSWLAQCDGKVGANIVAKLEKLVRQLPDASLRERAKATLDKLLAMRDYPVVLNHGDLIPTNTLVDEKTWEITGLVDWAEAEWLPFGTCLYGLEHLLGYLDSSTPSSPTFRYYEGADRLRKTFWDRLIEERPDMNEKLDDVDLMKDVGVFLWLGYAWDEGRIDRVVNEEDDAQEVVCLRSFLQMR